MAHIEEIGELEGKKSLSEDKLQRISSLSNSYFATGVFWPKISVTKNSTLS